VFEAFNHLDQLSVHVRIDIIDCNREEPVRMSEERSQFAGARASGGVLGSSVWLSRYGAGERWRWQVGEGPADNSLSGKGVNRQFSVKEVSEAWDSRREEGLFRRSDRMFIFW
jgi:hypothetical protein